MKLGDCITQRLWSSSYGRHPEMFAESSLSQPDLKLALWGLRVRLGQALSLLVPRELKPPTTCARLMCWADSNPCDSQWSVTGTPVMEDPAVLRKRVIDPKRRCQLLQSYVLFSMAAANGEPSWCWCSSNYFNFSLPLPFTTRQKLVLFFINLVMHTWPQSVSTLPGRFLE